MKKPWEKECWSSASASDSCMWSGVGCTVEICDGHEFDAEQSQPGNGVNEATRQDVKDFYWSKSCTWAQVNKMHADLVAGTTTAAGAKVLKAKDNARRAKACTLINPYSKECMQTMDWVTADHIQQLTIC